MLAGRGVWAVRGGDTNAVWDETEGKAFGGAMGKAEVVCPRVGERK